MKFRMLIVEDEPDWGAMFGGLIEASQDFEVGFLATGAIEARRAIGERRFDGALIDIGLPDGSGIEVLDYLMRRQPAVRAAMCTVFEDEDHVLRAIRAGAAGYILKQNAARDLVPLLRQMREGGAPLSPRVARHILRQFTVEPRERAGMGGVEDFTPREIEVLKAVAGGLTLKQAGRKLGIAESTVRTHVKNLYSKLGVNRRSAAIFEATQRKIL